MRLSSDLIRDTLITVEKELDHCTEDGIFYDNYGLHWKHIYENEYMQKTYDFDEVKYCLTILLEHGFIRAAVTRAQGNISFMDIDRMTWEGHEFLENIRDDNIWAKTKEKVKGIKSVSIQILSSVAAGVIKECITNPELLKSIVSPS